MRSKPFVLVASIAALLGLLALSPRASAQQFWDGSVTVGDGIIHGGSGVWNENETNTNWTDATGFKNNSYSDFTDVIFSGATGVVTLGSNITTNGNSLRFSTDGYVINPNGFALEMFRAFTVDGGVIATINAPITDSSISELFDLTKNGAGTLILSGVNTYTGITTINAGVLAISQDANLGTPPVTPVADQLTFNGGTLQTTASLTLNPNRGITLNAGEGFNGGTFDVTGANVLTYGGVITGAGSLTKVGSGNLILSGVNTYTGITTINAGVLAISQDANLGTPPATPVADQLTFNGGTLQATASFTLNPNRGITLNAGGTFDVTGANVLTYDGVISGSGNLTKVGTGKLTLSGANTYSGGTNLNGGIVAVNGDGNLGTGPLSFNGGTLEALAAGGGIVSSKAITLNSAGGTFLSDAGTASTLSGGITGGGAWTKAGSGILILTAANTYTGGTTISAGTLQLGNGGTTGSITGNVADNGVLAFNRSDSNTFGGVISGTGSVTQIGAGTTILTANNTYTGGTTISAGTLQIGNGGTTGSIVGNVIDNGVLAFNRTDSSTFGGVISGTGSLVKQGAGTLTLPGANTYTGTTTVNAGSLIVDGSIASLQTLVNAGALLGGHGSLGGSLVNNGIVRPGDSPGTLTVIDNYTQNAGGTLRIQIAGIARTEHDLLAVNGHASLAGTLQLIGLGGFKLHVGDQVTFLTANRGVSGTFGTVQNQFATGTLVEAQLVFNPDSVLLEGVQGSFVPVACTPNAVAVARALDSAVGDPRAAGLISFLDEQPINQLCGDLQLIAPEELASIFNAGFSLANVQTANLMRRMDDIRAGSTGFSSSGFTLNGSAPNLSSGFAGVTGPEGKGGPPALMPTPENRWGVWVTGIGEFANVDSTNNAAGFDIQTGGVTFGADYRVSSIFAIGLTAGYAHTNADLSNGGNLDVNGGTLGLYATLFAGGFYADAALTGGPSGYDTHRTALRGSANGSTNGGELNVLIAAGYDWKKGGLSIGPTANFQYTYVSVGGFTESGSIAPLNILNQNVESERMALGMKASYEWKVGHITVLPQISAAWQHEFGDQAFSIVASFANGAGKSFTVTSPQIGRDSLLIGAGAAILLNERISIYAYYDGELFRTNYQSNSVTAGVRVTF